MSYPSRKWDLFYLGMARYMSTASKDPSTKTGAVIVGNRGAVISVGFNGMPQRVKDTDERLNNRAIKYESIIHCEENALIFARQDLHDCTLFTWPFMSCSRCASKMIQAGIVRHVAPQATENQLTRWGDAFELSMELFVEAGVAVKLIGPGSFSQSKEKTA